MRPVESKVSIIIPTYNEKDHIVGLIDGLFACIPQPMEVIVVDDASPDGTAGLVEGLKFPELRLIKRKSRGLASALHRGVSESKGDIIGFMDADLTMPPLIMNHLISKLDKYEVAIGSRYVEGGSDNRASLRVYASRAVNWFARTMLGDHIRDYDSGFIAFRREVFEHVALSPSGYGDYFIEFIYDVIRAGYKIKEVGYALHDRLYGTSKSAESLIGFLILGLRYVIRIFSVRIHPNNFAQAK